MASYSYFNSPQRRIIQDYLGPNLRVLHLTKKLKAAGITRGWRKTRDGNVIVIDLGTGPLGISLLTSRDGARKLLAWFL